MLDGSDELLNGVAASLNYRQLNLILFPTEQCNFRCVYCYEDFKVGLMKPEVIAGVKALLSRRLHELDFLEIHWFGGEPLLAKKIIFDISSHVISLMTQRRELKYEANITTNGFLLDIPTFRRLASHGFRVFQISLDGERETHNQTRMGMNGTNTFDAIWERLICIRNSKDVDATIMLRVHYSPDTLDSVLALVDLINLEFSEDTRFSVFFTPIQHLGGPNDKAIRLFTEGEKIEVARILRERLRYQRMAYKMKGHYICYASKANSFVIRANGDIAKCTVALNADQNRVGRLAVDGSMHFERDRLLSWMKGLETLDAAALACPYRKMKIRDGAKTMRNN